MIDLKPQPIHNEDELSFAIFCIENVADKLGIGAEIVYHILTDESNILNNYIIPCYEVLHSQSKEYIVEDIISYMKEKGMGV